MLAIKADNITKVYRFYEKPIHRLLEAVWRRPMHKAFTALEGVSFSLDAGSTLGIIGENGAGKSTLLKILSKTLFPAGGSLEVNGRVAALLELGAGFHHELTGRQNIYLNASLMGLSDREVRAREKEIIDFADIGAFIDRPIKTYSSGMIVRLAFSIATSVDPDILIVDEALSVGDQRFQEKCVARMQDFRESGKTIIVCSHSMYLINELCAGCIWLENGRIRQKGPSNIVVSEYLACLESEQTQTGQTKDPFSSFASPEVVIEDIISFEENQMPAASLKQFRPFQLEVVTRALRKNFRGHLAVVLEGLEGRTLFSSISRDSHPDGLLFSDEQKFSFTIPSPVLQQGKVRIRVLVVDETALRVVNEKRTNPLPVVSKRPEYGLIWMEHYWNINSGTKNE